MAKLQIDLDRDVDYGVPARLEDPVTGEWKRGPRRAGGCVIATDPLTKSQVFMYRTEPGIYYSAHGTRVSTEMAERAGLDVKTHAAQRKKQLMIRQIDQQLSNEMSLVTREVVQELRGFKLVHLGAQRYIIEADDGTNLMPKHTVDLKVGQELLKDYAPEPADEPAKEVKNGDVQPVATARGRRTD